MSYIVPGERPRTCGVCPFARLSRINYGKCWCALDSTNTRSYANSYEKLDNCPLVEIPTQHGRLIDADKFKSDCSMKNDCAECEKELQGSSRACEYDRIYSKMDFCQWIDNAETVIEGSKT